MPRVLGSATYISSADVFHLPVAFDIGCMVLAVAFVAPTQPISPNPPALRGLPKCCEGRGITVRLAFHFYMFYFHFAYIESLAKWIPESSGIELSQSDGLQLKSISEVI